jgi:hypothetical protein
MMIDSFRFVLGSDGDKKTYKLHFENKHPKSELAAELKNV